MNGVASIVPIRHLNEIVEDDYFMALDHLCSDPLYMSFYQKRAHEGKFVILDNSTVELGEPVDPDEYIVDALRMDASEVLSPDWLYEADRTVESAKAFIRKARGWNYSGLIMAVPQGGDVDEWLDCAKRLIALPGVDCLGVSRRYTDFWAYRRLCAVQGLRQLCLDARREEVKVHLLGCHAMPEWDVAPSLKLPYVQGVDSSLPSLFSANGLSMTPGAPRPEGRIDFHHEYRLALLRLNLRRWRRLCHEEY